MRTEELALDWLAKHPGWHLSKEIADELGVKVKTVTSALPNVALDGNVRSRDAFPGRNHSPHEWMFVDWEPANRWLYGRLT